MRWPAARSALLSLVALVAFVPAAVRLVPPARSGPLSPASRSALLTLVGSLRLDPADQDAHADVAVSGRVAFVGNWTGPCPGGGVDLVDISNPAAPVRLGHTPEHPNTSMEVMRPIRIGGRDVLAIGLQDCRKAGAPAGRAGLELVDVTDPRDPTELSFFDVDAFGPRVVGVHELDVTRTPSGRSLALLAAPTLEAATAGADGRGGKGDLLIVDVSDPARPSLIGSWGVLGEPALGPAVYQAVRRGNDARTLLHSVRAGRAGRVAYLSYWDAGVVLLDISDPAHPRYLGRTTFGPADEGNAHSVAEAAGGALIVEADEVVDASEVQVASPALTTPAPAAPAAFAGQLRGGASLTAPVVAVGRGCPGDAYSADPADKLALIERGTCRIDQKVARAQQAGAVGALIFDEAADPDDLAPVGGDRSVPLPGGPTVALTIPAMLVRREVGLRLAEASPPATATAGTQFGGYGDLRLWDVRDPAHPSPVARFTTPEAHDPTAAAGGLWSVHNPEVRGTTLYASWYSDGIRVVDIAKPSAPRELASWTGAGRPADAPAVDVWGVAVSGDLVVASDRAYGLYILRLTG
ncbi:MAG TPA: PA domain-containing protein [Candidatus Dormibacteraeota bacterium]|nr:PA domain-containing protein [Candidatus Dormibacteraeota bacterium]